MIKRLNQLSLAWFIELSCGNNSVLLEENENVPEHEVKKLASELLIEYRMLINPSGVQAMIIEKEDILKVNAQIFLLKICKSLCLIEGYNEAREALKEVFPMHITGTDEQLKDNIESLLHEAEFYKKRIDDFAVKEGPAIDENTIRASFDSEIAFIMTYFKMQIDINTINAAVYANIAHRADMEIKLKMRGR